MYSVPCGLTWDADVASFVAEADIEAVVLSDRLRPENKPLNKRSRRNFFDGSPDGGSDISMEVKVKEERTTP